MTDEPSSDQPDFPALSDKELSETLDLMATAVASMSDRIDALTRAADKQIKVSTDARIAAFAARDQTDPKAFGQLVGEVIDGEIDENLARMARMATDLLKVSKHTQDVLKKAEEDRSAAQRAIWEREQKVAQFKARLPWFGLGAVVLALTMTLLLPRFIASFPSGCAALGGIWQTTTTGVNACVFYHP
ncbi:hypothetical protein [uncultured Tateyamaria sp.]|uniref:hypothetical protein n=1 Tax=uncultured Tateyamaria sp. TaxID=455651 RepID=UPI00261DEC1B|nr:hypothetical protein [uncultured Tateyamaria sp.]